MTLFRYLQRPNRRRKNWKNWARMKARIERTCSTLHKSTTFYSTFYFMRWKLRSNRWSHYGFPLGTSISRNIYGRTGKHFSYNIYKYWDMCLQETCKHRHLCSLELFASIQWKRSTLKTLVYRVHIWYVQMVITWH